MAVVSLYDHLNLHANKADLPTVCSNCKREVLAGEITIDFYDSNTGNGFLEFCSSCMQTMFAVLGLNHTAEPIKPVLPDKFGG